MNNRVGSLISSIVTFVLSLLMLYICYSMNNSIDYSGLRSLALLVTIPVYFILYALLFGTSLSTVFTSARGIGSDNKGVKITSIVMLVLGFIVLILAVLLIVNLMQIL